MNAIVISLGFMQFGVGITSFSNTQSAFANYFDWSDDEATKYGDIL